MATIVLQEMDEEHKKLIDGLAQYIIIVASKYPGMNSDPVKTVPKMMQAMLQAPIMFAMMNIQDDPKREDLYASLMQNEIKFLKTKWDWDKVKIDAKRIPKGPIL